MSIIFFYNREKENNSTGIERKDLNRHFAKEDNQMTNKHMINYISYKGNGNQSHNGIPLHTQKNG